MMRVKHSNGKLLSLFFFFNFLFICENQFVAALVSDTIRDENIHKICRFFQCCDFSSLLCALWSLSLSLHIGPCLIAAVCQSHFHTHFLPETKAKWIRYEYKSIHFENGGFVRKNAKSDTSMSLANVMRAADSCYVKWTHREWPVYRYIKPFVAFIITSHDAPIEWHPLLHALQVDSCPPCASFGPLAVALCATNIAKLNAS